MFSVLSTWIFKQFHFIIDLFISFKDVWSYFILQAKSHLAKSHLAKSHLAKSHLAKSHLAKSHLAKSHLAKSHLAKSHLAKSHLAKSHLAKSHLAKSHLAKSHLAKSTKSVTRVTPPMEIAACFPSHIAMKPITTALQKTLAKSGALWRRIMIKTLTSDGDTVVGVHLIVYKFILSSWLWGSCEESTSSH